MVGCVSKLKFATNEEVWQYCPWINIQLKQDNIHGFIHHRVVHLLGKGIGMLGGQLGMGTASSGKQDTTIAAARDNLGLKLPPSASKVKPANNWKKQI